MDSDPRPATVGDLNALEQRIDGKLDALEQRIDGKLDALEQRLDGKLDTVEQRLLDRMGEMIHDRETRLLQAFYGYAETNNKRLMQIDTDVM